MNYRLMTERLKAASKEMRQNVPMLKLIDDTIEKINRQTEEAMWFGSVGSEWREVRYSKFTGMVFDSHDHKL